MSAWFVESLYSQFSYCLTAKPTATVNARTVRHDVFSGRGWRIQPPDMEGSCEYTE